MNIKKTNFEKLDVYKLSEQLSDIIWDIVIEWDYFAKDTVGKQLLPIIKELGPRLNAYITSIKKKQTIIINKVQSTKHKAPKI